MSCYLRHMTDIIDEAGIVISRENRKHVDQAIHQIVGVTYKNCPAAWRKIKEAITSDEQKRRAFIDQLRRAIS